MLSGFKMPTHQALWFWGRETCPSPSGKRNWMPTHLRDPGPPVNWRHMSEALCLQPLKTRVTGFQSPGTFTADYSFNCNFENLIVIVVLILIGWRLRFLGVREANITWFISALVTILWFVRINSQWIRKHREKNPTSWMFLTLYPALWGICCSGYVSVPDKGCLKDRLITNVSGFYLLNGSFMGCCLPFLHEQSAPSTI